MTYDILIVGGGPSGLAAALTFGRARKRVLVCDAGPRRNAKASHVNGLFTRDGTPPTELRAIGNAQLAKYPSVETRAIGVEAITGERGAFEAVLGDRTAVRARRVLLATGMIDEPLGIPGAQELWGTSIYQCPYCHGWEVRDGRFGVLVRDPLMAEFPLLIRGWTRDLTMFTDAQFTVPPEPAARLAKAGVRIEEQAIARVVGSAGYLEYAELADGTQVPLDAMFAHPKQHQVPMIAALGLDVDPKGYVLVSEPHRQTSRPGIYAAGDLSTPMQSATVASAQGVTAAAMINHELTMELAVSGELAS